MYRVIAAILVFYGLFLAASPAPAVGAEGRGGALSEGFSEGFENINDLLGKGWVKINNSEPLGLTGWRQAGQDGLPVFPAHAGPPTSYILANFRNTSGSGTISNWLLTPEIELRNGIRIEFWTRTTDLVIGEVFPDRLEVRLSTMGDSSEVGDDAFSFGDFETLLLSINPELDDDGYPRAWTRYSIRLSGMAAGATGRIAFRYFVTDSGPNGTNGDLIGIDTFSVEQPLFSDRFEVGGGR
ncbi:MAG: choice-of-anchor J domain-containing protein [Wenzhouxiangella sp.]